MKLIIDIPEGIYKTLCKNPTADIVRQAVRKGTPLDNIKAEIDNQYKWFMQTEHTLYDIDIAFDAIKSLLDKHIRKEKE